MDEVLKQIAEALGVDPAQNAEGLEKAGVLLNHRVKTEADKITGAEEAVKGLKSTLTKKEEALAAFAKLGKADEIAAQLQELEEIKLKGKAKKAGAESDEIKRLVDDEVAKHLKTHAAEFEDQTTKLTARAEGAEAAAKTLEQKFLQALREFELYRSVQALGLEIEPVFWSVLVDKAAPYMATNGSEEEPWWQQATPERPGFSLHDPESKTRLKRKDGITDMTTRDLLEAKKAGDWSPFFRPKGKGSGARSTTTDGQPSKRLAWDAPINEWFAAAKGGA